MSELSDRCSRLEQLIATQQAELTEIKKRCAVLEHENAEYKKSDLKIKEEQRAEIFGNGEDLSAPSIPILP